MHGKMVKPRHWSISSIMCVQSLLCSRYPRVFARILRRCNLGELKATPCLVDEELNKHAVMNLWMRKAAEWKWFGYSHKTAVRLCVCQSSHESLTEVDHPAAIDMVDSIQSNIGYVSKIHNNPSPVSALFYGFYPIAASNSHILVHADMTERYLNDHTRSHFCYISVY